MNIQSIIVEKQGVVTLLDMLQFAANDFFLLSMNATKFSCLPDFVMRDRKHMEEFVKTLALVRGHCKAIGMDLSANQAVAIMEELRENGRAEKIKPMVDELIRRISEELDRHQFGYIPSDRQRYVDPKWLWDTDIDCADDTDEVIREFHAAGRCYAFDESTACVFHLMRIVDWCLRKVAASLSIAYDASNWRGIGKKISDEMEKKYQTKTDEWKKQEPFYAEILTDIQAISRAHRNPALHDIQKNYEPKEALYMLTVVEEFSNHVARNL